MHPLVKLHSNPISKAQQSWREEWAEILLNTDDEWEGGFKSAVVLIHDEPELVVQILAKTKTQNLFVISLSVHSSSKVKPSVTVFRDTDKLIPVVERIHEAPMWFKDLEYFLMLKVMIPYPLRVGILTRLKSKMKEAAW